ncbi:hypothetical protein ACFVXE_35255 [Streptomyces sp. NPDC058231]|uniref:hypothetical protein n=1 Tax=Streptomyces sp. NPDC058231 TaxID=3346392 RepID=UPI0036E4952C
MRSTLRAEVAPLGINVMAVEPGAFRTRAYAGFADEPVQEAIEDYRPMLQSVHAAMVEQDGKQPGDTARAVVAAMNQDDPPRQLVLGGAGFERAVGHIETALAGIRAHETLSRGADYAPGR